MRFSISYRRDDGIIAADVLSRLISERSDRRSGVDPSALVENPQLAVINLNC